MNVTNDMAEAALDALDDACIGFNRSNPRASVHWKGFTRDDRVAAMRTALSAALAKQDAAIALMRGQSEEKPMEPNMHKTIYDLAIHCGADVDGGEYPDHSANFAGSPPTITFTDRQLEKFAEKLLDRSYLYVGGERQLTSAPENV